MRKNRFVPLVPWIVFAFLLVAPLVMTDEPGSPTLAKAAASYYNAADNMKDLAVDVKEVREMSGNKLVLEGRFYWKAPNREWIDGKDGLTVQGLDRTAGNIMPARELWNIVQALKKMKVVESKEGEETKIEATPKSGDAEQPATYYVDAQNRITHYSTNRVLRDGKIQKVDVMFESEEREGKRLLTMIGEKIMGMPNGKMSKWEYEQVNGVFLVRKETHYDLVYRSETEWTNPKVNGGVDESVFKNSAMTPEEAKKAYEKKVADEDKKREDEEAKAEEERKKKEEEAKKAGGGK